MIVETAQSAWWSKRHRVRKGVLVQPAILAGHGCSKIHCHACPMIV
jgi:hypothetical protein